MWALVENENVTMIFTRPQPFHIGTGKEKIKYPSDIFTKWTPIELKEIGVFEVVLMNEPDKKIHRPQVLDKATFVLKPNHVEATFDLIPLGSLAEIKIKFKKQVKSTYIQILNIYVDPYYIRKYRIELEPPRQYTVPAPIKDYSVVLDNLASNYLAAVDSATHIVQLKDLEIIWPDPPNI